MTTMCIISVITSPPLPVDVDRTTDSLETAAVEFFAQLSGKESSLHVPVFAFSYTAGERAPALSFVVLLRTVLCLTAL